MKYFRASCVLSSVVFFQPFLQAEETPASAFFAHEDYYSAALAPDGKLYAATISLDQTTKLVIFETESQEPMASYNSPKDRDIRDVWWANNERVIFNMAIRKGWLDHPITTGELFALNINDKKRHPVAGYTAGDGTAFDVLDVMSKDHKFIRVVSRTVKAQRIDSSRPTAYKLDIYMRPRQGTGSNVSNRRLSQKITSPLPWGSFVTDNLGEVRLAYYFSREGLFDVRQISADGKNEWSKIPGFDPITSKLVGNDVEIVGFSADNRSFYYLSPGQFQTQALSSFNLETNISSVLYEHKSFDVGIGDLIRASDDQIVGVNLLGTYSEVHFFVDHADINFIKRIHRSFPGERVTIYDYTEDALTALVEVHGDQNPGVLYLYEIKQRSAKPLLYSRSLIKPEQMSQRQPFVVRSDGMDIYGFVTLPDSDGSNFPTVVLVHGGPFGVRDTFLFDAEAQFLASRGFAVVQVNYRGSAGYGVDFSASGRLQWGDGMISDVNQATRWAIQNNISDPNRICIFGSSYGAFAAMNAVIQAPDIYRCVVGMSGVYDLNKMYKTDILLFPWGNSYLESALGTDEVKLRTQSPLHNAEKITVPVFVAHGGRDRRSPPEQAKSFRSALDKANVSYEWMFEKDEGHGFYATENRLNFYERLVTFLNRHTRPDV